MDEFEVKKLIADLMDALDKAGESEHGAYEAAQRWMETGSAKPIFNVRVKVSRDHYYRVQADDFEEAARYAEDLVCDQHDYSPDDWMIDSDEEEENVYDFDSLPLNDAA